MGCRRYSHAVAGGDVTRKHVPQESAFPGTKASEHCRMASAPMSTGLRRMTDEL
jgi:hypothetical protein